MRIIYISLLLLISSSLSAQISRMYIDGLGDRYVMQLEDARKLDVLSRKGLRFDETRLLYYEVIENFVDYREKVGIVLKYNEIIIDSLSIELLNARTITENYSIMYNKVNKEKSKCCNDAIKFKEQRNRILWTGLGLLSGIIVIMLIIP